MKDWECIHYKINKNTCEGYCFYGIPIYSHEDTEEVESYYHNKWEENIKRQEGGY